MPSREGSKFEVDIFASLGRELGSTTDAETAARIILDAADQLIGWDASYLILYDPTRGISPRPLLTIDTFNGKRVIQREAVPEKPTANMLAAIEMGGFLSLYEDHFEIDPSLSFGDHSKRTLSQMFVAVATRSRTIGVLSIQSYKKNAYENSQLELLKNLASHCAGALERIWAQEALSDQLERLKILHHAVNDINARHDVEHICKVVFETVRRVMPCNDFVMDGYNEKTNMIEPIFAVEHPGRRVFTESYFADHGLSGEIVRTKSSLLFNSVEAMDASGIQFELYGSHGDQPEDDPTCSIIAVPMILHGKTYGMVSAQSYQPNAYTNDDLYLLETLASHAAIAIENARLFDSIQYLANTDPLTETLNRRRFYELAERDFHVARLNKQPFAVIMLDVDDFKKFNDAFGHKVGDHVLVLVTDTCRSALRASDIFGRLGGEEFALALPKTQLGDAVEIANRLRNSIHEKNFNIDIEFANVPARLSVTVSVGVAASDATCKTLDMLMEHADKAMYIAKNSGRDRVHVWRVEADG